MSRDAGSGPILPFWKSRERRSLSQEPATKQRGCSLRICKDTGVAKQTRTVSLSSGKNGSLFIWAKLKHRSSTLPALLGIGHPDLP